MKTSFRKIAASMIAVASLAIGVTGVNASATDVTNPEIPEIIDEYSGPMGYVSFGSGAIAGIYRDSTQVNISTSYNSGTTVRVKLKSTSGSVATGDQKDKWGYDGYISGNYNGNGFTSATSYHEGAGGSITLTR